MKKYFLSVVAIVYATTFFAQVQSDIRTATLIHGDQTTVYYGAGAFGDAYNAAAEEGEVIVLSPGEFGGSTYYIRKSITIYGSGYETDPISGSAPTVMTAIRICPQNNSDTDEKDVDVYPTVHVEGICFKNETMTPYAPFVIEGSAKGGTIENLLVRKCKISMHLGIDAATRNCRFSQCYILGIEQKGNDGHYRSGTSYYPQKQLTFENCWIGTTFGGSLENTIHYDHCIIANGALYSYAHFSNCIINSHLADNCTANNCIFASSTIGNDVSGSNNWTGVALDDIFEDANKGFNYSADNNFKLKFPHAYIGTDGTEVGINGGVSPFNRISPIPRILSSDIDITTSQDGKLKVSIHVEAQTNK